MQEEHKEILGYSKLYYEENPKQAVLKMRKHIAWYLKGMKNSTYIKDRINREEKIKEVKKMLIEFFTSNAK